MKRLLLIIFLLLLNFTVVIFKSEAGGSGGFMTGMKFPIDGNRSPFYQTPRLFNPNKAAEKQVAASQGDTIQTFLTANEEKRNKLLQQLDPQERKALFNSLRQRYITAGDKNCEDAIFTVSVYEIKQMPGSDNIEGLIVNIIKFMYQNAKNKKGGGGTLSAKQILASGEVDGCYEAARLFVELFRSVNSGIESNFVYTFDKNWALKLKNMPDGCFPRPIMSKFKTKEEQLTAIQDWATKTLKWLQDNWQKLASEEKTKESARLLNDGLCRIGGHVVIEIIKPQTNDKTSSTFFVDASSFLNIDRYDLKNLTFEDLQPDRARIIKSELNPNNIIYEKSKNALYGNINDLRIDHIRAALEWLEKSGNI